MSQEIPDSRRFKSIDINRMVCPIMISHTHIWGDWYYHHNGGGEFENDWRECVMCGLIDKRYRYRGENNGEI